VYRRSQNVAKRRAGSSVTRHPGSDSRGRKTVFPLPRHADYNTRMSDSQKKPGIAFWATVALVISLPLLYVLAYGPWTWVVVHVFQNVAYIDAGGFYSPLYGWLQADGGPKWISDPYCVYLNWWEALGTEYSPHIPPP
jgi:hypothetical protein